ncbi:MAG: hypothetical protein AAFW47_04375 [Pseudomonadota bacterium]
MSSAVSSIKAPEMDVSSPPQTTLTEAGGSAVPPSESQEPSALFSQSALDPNPNPGAVQGNPTISQGEIAQIGPSRDLKILQFARRFVDQSYSAAENDVNRSLVQSGSLTRQVKAEAFQILNEIRETEPDDPRFKADRISAGIGLETQLNARDISFTDLNRLGKDILSEAIRRTGEKLESGEVKLPADEIPLGQQEPLGAFFERLGSGITVVHQIGDEIAAENPSGGVDINELIRLLNKASSTFDEDAPQIPVPDSAYET